MSEHCKGHGFAVEIDEVGFVRCSSCKAMIHPTPATPPDSTREDKPLRDAFHYRRVADALAGENAVLTSRLAAMRGALEASERIMTEYINYNPDQDMRDRLILARNKATAALNEGAV